MSEDKPIVEQDVKALLPQPFHTKDFDIVGADAVAQLFSRLKKGPDYIIFPSHYDCRRIQKMIISTAAAKELPGKDGTLGRYIVLPAYSRGVYFNTTILYDDTPFMAQFPKTSFFNMFYKAACVHFDDLVLKLLKTYGEAPMFEIHFQKENDRTYTLKYMSLVVYNGVEENDVGRKIHMFQELQKFFEEEAPIKGRKKKKQ